jgi:hypothetical protein
MLSKEIILSLNYPYKLLVYFLENSAYNNKGTIGNIALESENDTYFETKFYS